MRDALLECQHADDPRDLLGIRAEKRTADALIIHAFSEHKNRHALKVRSMAGCRSRSGNYVARQRTAHVAIWPRRHMATNVIQPRE
jgi:hypothetical protein